MENNSELIIEVADEYESLKTFESGNPSLKITYLAVSKKYQNLKIGSTLIDFIANIARNQNVSGCIFLTVNALHTANYSAVSFYEKNHFAKLTPIPQLDVWPMYKTLWY